MGQSGWAARARSRPTTYVVVGMAGAVLEAGRDRGAQNLTRTGSSIRRVIQGAGTAGATLTSRDAHATSSWRRGRDSNPRYGDTVRLISSQVHSTTLPPLR